MEENPLRLKLTPNSDRYVEDDERWIEQVSLLRREMKLATGSVVTARVASPGAKGAIDELIIALGSAGAFTATVEIVRAFLTRDRLRSVAAEWTDGQGRSHKVELRAGNAGPDVLAPLIDAFAHRIEAGS
jgi:hypothetical protein